MKDRIERTNRTKVSHRLKHATLGIAALTIISSIMFSIAFSFYYKDNSRLSRSIEEKQQEIADLEEDNDYQKLRHNR